MFKPSEFIYNDGGLPDIGFIAEDVALVDPRFAYYDAGGRPSSLRLHGILSVTVKAVQELDVRTAFIANAATSTVLTVDVAGNVGIGTNAPSAKFTVSGNVFADSYETARAPVASFTMGSM